MSHQGDGNPGGLAEALLVFDDSLCLQRLARALKGETPESVVLYPLTSNFARIDALETWLRQQGARSVRWLDAVADVDAQVGGIREAIADWVRGVGNANVENRSVKDWFYIERYGVSAWWLGLLAEKNTLKTRAFLHVAQILALEAVLRGGRFSYVVIALTEPSVANALHSIAHREAIRVLTPGTGLIDTLRTRAAERNQRGRWIGAAVPGVMAWLRLCAKWAAVRLMMGGVLPDGKATFLFATYFPAFDQSAAAQGRFVNRYTGPLQTLLDRLTVPVTWLLVYVPLHGAGLLYALRQARRFRANGTSLLFPEQLLTPTLLVQIIGAWLRQIVIARRVCRALDIHALASPPMSVECRAVIERLWRASFAGAAGLQGLAYLAMFRRLWCRAPVPRALAYICEMHAWEKALLGTRRGLADDIAAIGVQHTVVARDYFHYFASPADVNDSDSRQALPLPEFLAVNGPGPGKLLSQCHYRGVREVEALRYIDSVPRSGSPAMQHSPAVPALLVIGSLDKWETRAVARLVNAAFRGSDEVCIKMKSHPYTPFEEVLSAADIDWRREGYGIVDGAMADCLQQATAVLVGSSAVAVEAAALGKVVIVPKFADTMVMSPLEGTTAADIRIVRNPEELRQCWREILQQPESCSGAAAAMTEAGAYWHLDPELPRWTALLREAGALRQP